MGSGAANASMRKSLVVMSVAALQLPQDKEAVNTTRLIRHVTSWR